MILYHAKSSGWPSKKDLEDLVEQPLKQYFGEIFRTAVKLSPVYTGAFRASWRISLNTPREDVTEGRNPDNPIRGASFHWPSDYRLGDTVIISNNQPYAELIEYGGLSLQAPAGVLRLAIAAAKLKA